MIERKGILTLAGKGVTVIGADLQIGQAAPEFTAQTHNWEMVQPLDQARGMVRIIAALPSLDTSVCDRETRRFNEEASSLSEDIQIVIVSTDLPITQKRWCSAAGIDRVQVVSDHMAADFGQKYGVLIKERRIFRRAVFVVDRDGNLVYVDYMPSLGDEPDYEAVLQTAQSYL